MDLTITDFKRSGPRIA